MADTLRVGTSVDVSGIQSGMGASASAVDQNVNRMVAAFQRAAAASKSASQTILYDWAGRPLAQAASDTDKLGDAVERVGQRTRSDMTSARYAIRGLGEEVGVHMPRFVANWLASIGGVGAVMSVAFTPIAVVGLVEILAELPGSIDKIKDRFAGWTEEAKKAYEESQKAATEALKATIEHKKMVYELSAIDKSPEGEHAARSEANKKHLEDVTRAMDAQRKLRDEAQDTIDRAEHPKKVGEEQTFNQFGESRRRTVYQAVPDDLSLKKAKADLPEIQKRLEELGQSYQKAVEEGQKLAAERPKVEKESAVRIQEIQLQVLENEKKLALARIELAKDTAVKTAGTAAVEMAAQIAAENQRFAIEKEFADKSNALKRRMAAEEHRPAGPGIDIATLGVEHEQKLNDIRFAGQEKERKQADETLAFWLRNLEQRRKNYSETADAEIHLENEIRDKSIAAEEIRTRAEADHARAVLELGKTRVQANTGLNETARVEQLKQLELAEYRVTMAIAARTYAQAKAGNDEKGMAEAQKDIDALSARYANTVTQLNARLTNAQVKPWMSMFDSIEKASEQMVNGMIQGHLRASQVLSNMWRGMADTFIANLMRMAAQRLIASQMEANQERKDALVAAKSSAVHAFKWVMKEVPFPANVVLAPLTAATMFAGAMSFASFDRGGIVPETMIAQVHRGERVLDERQTSKFEKALNSLSGSGEMAGGSPQYHFHQAPGTSPHHVTESVDIFKRMMRDGKLKI
ncbi:MAG TPA: hypothetical protein VN736_23200 [Candidatus Limnocylindrales bacterium]|nr:hypothetical protein [Candidatus Limnocylindrales bacterium]